LNFLIVYKDTYSVVTVSSLVVRFATYLGCIVTGFKSPILARLSHLPPRHLL